MTAIKINEQIAFLRKKKGLTQEELANALGVTNQAVSKWESAQCCPDINLLPLIADFFGVSIDELMGHRHMTENEDLVEDLVDKALALLKNNGYISVPVLQRHLGIGYYKAKTLISQLAENGYIEPSGNRNYVLKK